MWWFLLTSALVIYILAGYPVWLSYCASRRRRDFVWEECTPTVSIIIPVRNGARFLRTKLESVYGLDYPPHLMEVLVVSDGSTDETNAIAMQFASRGLLLLSIPQSGKAAAINDALLHAQGSIVVLTDVRQTLHPSSLRYLLGAFADSSVGVASGELVLREGTTRGEANVGLYWKYESWIRKNLSAIDSMFGATGPFYAIRRELFVPIPEDILLDDMFLPLTAFFRNYRLVVEPRALAYDYPMTPRREFRRKLRTLGGNYQLLIRMPQLLTPGNRMLWHFICYKVGRLLLPWLFLALLLLSPNLPAPWNVAVLSVQLFLYAIALLDKFIPSRLVLKRISSPAHTFLVLMAATLGGLQVFFVNPRTLWKVTDIAD